MKTRGPSEDSIPVANSKGRDTVKDLESTAEKPANSHEQKQQIFRERALKLAQRPDTADGQEDNLELIEFMLAHEHYAIEMAYVREVYPFKDLTPVPCTPRFVIGIISIRGQVISVVDIKDFFDLPKKEITDEFRVIIVKNDDMEFGILADTVIGEIRIPVSHVQLDMPSLKGTRAHYVKGVTQERLIIMNVDKLLSDENIIVHEEVST